MYVCVQRQQTASCNIVKCLEYAWMYVCMYTYIFACAIVPVIRKTVFQIESYEMETSGTNNQNRSKNQHTMMHN